MAPRRAFGELLAATPSIEVLAELEAYSDASAIFHVRRIRTDSRAG
jgi:hypothetical protein